MLRFYKKNEEPEQKDFSIGKKIVSKATEKLSDSVKLLKRTGKKISSNPGHFVRKQAASSVQNPTMAAATAGDIGLSYLYLKSGYPILASPLTPGLKTAAVIPSVSKSAGKIMPGSKKTAKEMMDNSGKSTASKIGKNIEYYTNKGLIGLSNFGHATQGMFSKTEEQKNYTIQEGHYTGPKDMEKVPGTIEVLGKATIGGSGIGAVTGGLLKELGNVENTGILDGAKKGGKIGFFTGIAIKALLNHLHKPMSKVKYQEVDRHLRKEFGMFRVAGLTIGDTREKRKTYDEKFGTNDRDVTKYPINICVNNNQVTMYTLNLSDELLEKLNQSLDYYCKKYAGMEYSSRVINSRTNTYSVNITFTNYDAISSFIMEISEVLGVRINLLNNEILPETKIGKSETHDEEESRVYSNIPSFSRYDIGQIFSRAGAASISALALAGPKVGFAVLVHQTLSAALNRFGAKEVVRLIGGKRKDFDNDFLLYELGRLRYVEGFHYTVGEEKSDINISMMCGKVIITTTTGSKPDLLMTKILGNIDYKKTEVNGKANLWTFLIQDKGSFDIFLKTLIGYVKPNIFK